MNFRYQRWRWGWSWIIEEIVKSCNGWKEGVPFLSRTLLWRWNGDSHALIPRTLVKYHHNNEISITSANQCNLYFITVASWLIVFWPPKNQHEHMAILIICWTVECCYGRVIAPHQEGALWSSLWNWPFAFNSPFVCFFQASLLLTRRDVQSLY